MTNAERALMLLGGRCLNTEFDKVCGKTAMTIKEPEFPIERTHYRVEMFDRNMRRLYQSEPTGSKTDIQRVWTCVLEMNQNNNVKQLVKYSKRDGRQVIQNVSC